MGVLPLLVPGLQILAPVAWIMGHIERQKIARGELAPNQLVTIGWALGIVVTILGVLAFFIFMKFFIELFAGL